MAEIRNKREYKDTGIRSSKSSKNNLYKNLFKREDDLFTKRECSGTFLHSQKWATRHKILSGLAKEIWDYLLNNGVMITVEYLSGIFNLEVD